MSRAFVSAVIAALLGCRVVNPLFAGRDDGAADGGSSAHGDSSSGDKDGATDPGDTGDDTSSSSLTGDGPSTAGQPDSSSGTDASSTNDDKSGTDDGTHSGQDDSASDEPSGTGGDGESEGGGSEASDTGPADASSTAGGDDDDSGTESDGGSESGGGSEEPELETSEHCFSTLDQPILTGGGSIIQFSVPLDVTPQDIDVRLRVAHPTVGLINATVIRGSGSVMLLHHTASSCAADGLDVVVSDQSPDTLELACMGVDDVVAATIQPLGSLAELNSQGSAGWWQLRISDAGPESLGRITNWCLIFSYIP
ncbi:MAG: hypothetical protein B7733_04000 [Myxococcales bacterium FL481]|nr:MAG: hypothetical protein B7733_04000 [Myxococcales bacterium FL481]